LGRSFIHIESKEGYEDLLGKRRGQYNLVVEVALDTKFLFPLFLLFNPYFNPINSVE